MGPDLIGYMVAAGFALAVAGFCVGRLTGAGAARRRELEDQLANSHEERSRLAAEGEDLREQLRAAREEHEAYRLSVVDHFSGTSDLLRDLTVQYRSVYEHLTKGASTLCPEGFVGLTEGLPVPEIGEASVPGGTGEDAKSAASVEQSASDEDFKGAAPPASA